MLGHPELLLLSGGAIDFVRLTTDVPVASFAFTSDEIDALAIVFADGSGLTPAIAASAGGWTTTNPGDWDPAGGSAIHARRLFSKVLTAGDVSSGLTLSGLADPGGGAAILYIVRGPTSLAVRSNTDQGGTTLSLPGFAPAANTEGVVAFIADALDATFTAPATPAPSVRLPATTVGSSWMYGVCDWGPADYDGAAKVFTGFGTNRQQNGILVELLR